MVKLKQLDFVVNGPWWNSLIGLMNLAIHIQLMALQGEGYSAMQLLGFLMKEGDAHG